MGVAKDYIGALAISTYPDGREAVALFGYVALLPLHVGLFARA